MLSLPYSPKTKKHWAFCQKVSVHFWENLPHFGKIKIKIFFGKTSAFKAKNKLATLDLLSCFFLFPPLKYNTQKKKKKKKKDHHPKSSTKFEYFEYPEKELKKKVEKKFGIKFLKKKPWYSYK
jgi:hypothetical protein